MGAGGYLAAGDAGAGGRDGRLVSAAGAVHRLARGPGPRPHISLRLADQPFVMSPRENWPARASGCEPPAPPLRPAPDADPVRAADTDLLARHPGRSRRRHASRWTPRRNRSPNCATGSPSARPGCARSCTAARTGPAGRPDLTSGGWQWMAQAAAVTSHLSELALRSLAERAGQLPAPAGDHSPSCRARLMALAGMRTAWQQVGVMWNTIITERRLLATLAMSEASDLLLRMGRLVWDNPQWTPARADRGPRRDPGRPGPGPDAFTAVVSAAHQAADALARVAVTDTATVQAAAHAGRLFVPTRSLPVRFDIPVRSRPR